MHDSPVPGGTTVQEYLARVPTDQDWARREAARYRDLSTDERFDVLEGLQRLAGQDHPRQKNAGSVRQPSQDRQQP